MNLISICKSARECSKEIGSLSNLKRNQILKDISENLNSQESLILRANKKDLANNTRLPIEIRERLILNPKKLRNIITSINNIRKLNDPLLSNEEFTRNDGLVIKKQPVPIGVIAAIYESRPNVTIIKCPLSEELTLSMTQAVLVVLKSCIGLSNLPSMPPPPCEAYTIVPWTRD